MPGYFYLLFSNYLLGKVDKMLLKYERGGCVAWWWVFSNVVSTLETLAAFVLHITGAGQGGGCKW